VLVHQTGWHVGDINESHRRVPVRESVVEAASFGARMDAPFPRAWTTRNSSSNFSN
jgi:hypothetical protein